MEITKVMFLFLLLAMCYADARNSKDVYNIEIDERGTLFNETVKINEKDGSVDFQVPDHNNVVQSEIRYDYKMGYFATRIPKLKECYVQRIPKDQSSSLKSVKRNLELYQVFKRSKSTVPVKTVRALLVKERRTRAEELSPSLRTFCGDFETYIAGQMYHEGASQAYETDGKERNKRRDTYDIHYLSINKVDLREEWVKVTLNTCEKLQTYFPALVSGGCDENTDEWDYSCGAKTETCVYYVKCKFDKSAFQIRCQETHHFTGWTCCDVKCPGQ